MRNFNKYKSTPYNSLCQNNKRNEENIKKNIKHTNITNFTKQHTTNLTKINHNVTFNLFFAIIFTFLST